MVTKVTGAFPPTFRLNGAAAARAATLAFIDSPQAAHINLAFSGMSARVGVRETRRIVGVESLTESDVLEARKREDGVAKGSHHVDIHQSGTGQIRIPVKDGGSYDIPWGCLLPKGIANVVAAGRILSADRGAHGSARVMGPCLAMGHAAGTASAMLLQAKAESPSYAQVDVAALRARLQAEGAVLDGTR